jgi:hypothetical protein
MNATKQFKIYKVIAGSTATTGTVTGSAVDMGGWEGAVFFGTVGTANAGNYAKLQQSDDDAVADDYTDIAASKVTPSVSGNEFHNEIYKPLKRYLKCLLIIGSSSAYGDVFVLLFRGRKAPVVDETTVDANLIVSPAEGTA